MKKLLNFCRAAQTMKTGIAVVVGIALGSAFWLASTPLAHGQAKLTPVEMIQSRLPQGKTIATASNTELLDAVCKAVTQRSKDAPLIVRTAAGARKEIRPDILCMAIRCTRDDKGQADCTWVVDMVREWIKAEPKLANQLVESVSSCSPDCRDALQTQEEGGGAFGVPPGNINPPPGSSGGGGSTNTCTVCHNGQNIQVSCDELQSYLSGHPGDTAGACEATAVTNK